eukprot:6272282-Alexandrium_andersonii.AAC.1
MLSALPGLPALAFALPLGWGLRGRGTLTRGLSLALRWNPRVRRGMPLRRMPAVLGWRHPPGCPRRGGGGSGG